MGVMYEHMVDACKSYNEWVDVVDTYRYMCQYIQWVDIYNRYNEWLHTTDTMARGRGICWNNVWIYATTTQPWRG